MSDWIEWTELNWGEKTKHLWVRINGPVAPPLLHAERPYKEGETRHVAATEFAHWTITDFTTRKELLAGPFDTREAAKAAYLLMFGGE